MVSPTKITRPRAPVAMTIAGSDSGANAGIQADLLTFVANQVYGTSAITCLTAQNPEGVRAIHPSPIQFISEQVHALLEYFEIDAVKTGMLFNQEIILEIARLLSANPQLQLVVDPVMVASSGNRLLENSAIDALKRKLLPLASVITPNLDEAEILYGEEIRTPEAMQKAAIEMADEWDATILLKGGHLEGNELFDIVGLPSGESHTFAQTRIQSVDTHGSGCTLSAAITAQLAKGEEALSAISIARNYLRRCMEDPIHLSGKRLINHFPR